MASTEGAPIPRVYGRARLAGQVIWATKLEETVSFHSDTDGGKGAAQQGTFNGNPLSARAGLAALTQVLTPDAYRRFAELGTMLAEGCRRAIEEAGIPAHTMDLGAKGCVSYRVEPLRNYRDYLETNPALFAASFPWMVNRGVFLTPGDEEQWTLSVQHTEDDVRRYVDTFGEFCQTLAG